jgi:hypothetical protein
MQIYLPESARRDGAYLANHFLMQAEYFCPERIQLTNSLSGLSSGDWALLIRAPGAFSLSRQSLDMRGRRGQSTVFEMLTRDERDALRSRKGSLILDLGWEMLFTYDDVMDGLVESIENLQIDPRRIFLIQCNFAANNSLARRWMSKTSLPTIQNMAFPVALSLMNVWQQKRVTPEDVENRLSEARVALTKASRSRRYCFFNGEPRTFRLMLLCHLAARGVLDDGFVSMLGYSKGPSGPGDTRSESERYRSFARKVGAADDVVNVIDAVLARLPLNLDVNAEEVRSSLEQVAWTSPDRRFYNDSWFSLVADTLFFDQHALFVTEKVLKPIINASPFVYFGCPGAIRHLESWGFQTHTGIFAPGHDLLEDGNARMESGISSVVAACKMPESDLRDAVIAEWPTSAANYRHFWWGFRDRLADGFRGGILDAIAHAQS